MKKIITLLIVSLFSLSIFVACTENTTPTTTDTIIDESSDTQNEPRPWTEEEKLSKAESAARWYIRSTHSEINEVEFTTQYTINSFPTEFRFRGYYVIDGFYSDITFTFTIEVEVDDEGNARITSYDYNKS